MPVRKDIDTLQQRIHEAIRNLNELKTTPQPLAGDSWIFYRHNIAPSWDFEVHNVTDPNYKKRYIVTYQVPDPSRGFINMFYFYEYDTANQDMSFHTEPVGDDPYSFWLTVKHVDYNSNSAGISIRFLIFSPQQGNLVFVEQVL